MKKLIIILTIALGLGFASGPAMALEVQLDIPVSIQAVGTLDFIADVTSIDVTILENETEVIFLPITFTSIFSVGMLNVWVTAYSATASPEWPSFVTNNGFGMMPDPEGTQPTSWYSGTMNQMLADVPAADGVGYHLVTDATGGESADYLVYFDPNKVRGYLPAGNTYTGGLSFMAIAI